MVYSDGADISSRFSLRDGETLIGRAQDCSIVLNVPNVSRHHARLKVAEGRCSLRDESTFGTHVNGSLVHNAEVPLKDGDVFQCGAVLFNLEQDAPPEFLSEEHQLLQDAHSIVRPIDAGLLPAEPQNAESRNASTSTLSATSLRPERRKGGDRRQTQQPLSGPERRAGRDRRQLRFLRLLSEISSTLVAVLPLPQVLSRVVDLVFEVVPAERVFLLLRDSADEAITPRVQRARDGSMPDATLSRTIVTKVLRERVAMLADDARYDSRLDGSGSIHAMLNVRSFMCAPLWNRQDVIGVLYADNPKSKRFIPEDLDVFTAIANYAAVAIEQARVAEQLQNEMRKRERLQRYHSPSVVNRIIGSTDVDAAFAAQERDLTVMFVDLVSFTKRSEHMNPLDVSKLLNHFFASMAEHIFELDGTLDKFIGDAILAVFGAPFSQEDHADRAIESALAMRQALREMNQELGSDPLSMRIALNSGIALTGDIGSPRRREFTVLGDVVNTCSRLQSSVCEPDQIVCTRATLDRARKAFKTRALGSISVRGREGEVEVFEIR